MRRTIPPSRRSQSLALRPPNSAWGSQNRLHEEQPPAQPQSYYVPPPPPVAQESEGLGVYFRLMWQHKWILASAMMICAAAGYVISLGQPQVYETKATLEIQNFNDNFMNLRDLDPTMVNTASDTYFQTQVRALESKTLLRRVIQKLNLVNHPEPLEQPPSLVSRLVGLVWHGAEKKPARPDAAAIEQILDNNLTVRGSTMTRVLEINFSSSDPDFAALFANTMAREYIAQSVELRSANADDTNAWLSQNVDDLKLKLEKAETRLQAYAKSTNLIYTSNRESVAEQKLKELQDELSKAQADRVIKQSRYELTTNAPVESIPDEVSDSNIRDLQAKIAELRRQAADLGSVMTPSHPKLQSVDAQIAELRKTLLEAREATIRRLKNDFQVAQRREDLLKVSYSEQSRLVTNQSTEAIQYNLLQREVDTLQTLYNTMMEKVKESTIASALRTSNIRVMDRADVPRRPVSPNRTQEAAFGGLFGILLGTVLAFVREQRGETFQVPGDAAALLNLSELGAIPSAEYEKGPKRIKGGGDPGTSVITLREAGKSNGWIPSSDDGEMRVVAWRDPSSLISEMFRSTLASTLFAMEFDTSNRQTLVITSPSPREGKSTVLVNLSAAWASTGKRILIIDGDLRRPRLHKFFDLSNKFGLSDLLSRPDPLPDLKDAIHPTEVPNLFVLPAGQIPINPSSLLYSRQLTVLHSRLRRMYDGILFDSPPMMHLSDARLLGRMADAAILVVRAGETSSEAAVNAAAQLEDDGVILLGTILNDWNPKHSKVGNDYYGGYRTYYSEAGSS